MSQTYESVPVASGPGDGLRRLEQLEASAGGAGSASAGGTVVQLETPPWSLGGSPGAEGGSGRHAALPPALAQAGAPPAPTPVALIRASSYPGGSGSYEHISGADVVELVKLEALRRYRLKGGTTPEHRYVAAALVKHYDDGSVRVEVEE